MGEEARPQAQPFVLRFRAAYFGVPMGLGAQAILWLKYQVLKVTAPTAYSSLRATSEAFWWAALVALLACFVLLGVKIAQFPNALIYDMCSPVRVNFLFMPFIATSMLLISVPSNLYNSLAIQVVFYLTLVLDMLLRIFLWGEWLVSKQLSLLEVYSPGHLSLINMLLLALLALGEAVNQPYLAEFLVSVAVVYYFVILTKSYGRAIDSVLPERLLPALFFYLPPPFVTSMVWSELPHIKQFDKATGVGFASFGSFFFFYFGIFLYFVLLRFVVTFARLPFSLSFWAYTFPTAVAASATTVWSVSEGVGYGAEIFAYCLGAFSSVIVVIILCTMAYKIFTKQSLFPPDEGMAFILDKDTMRGYDDWYKKQVDLLGRNPFLGSGMSTIDHVEKLSPWRYYKTQVEGQQLAQV